MKILIVNLKHSPNVGDGLIASCIEHELTRQGHDFLNVDLSGRRSRTDGDSARSVALAVLPFVPPHGRRLLTRLLLSAGRLPSLRSALRSALTQADAMILGGGNIFSDTNLNFPLKLHLTLSSAGRAGCPVAISGVGVSPSWSREGLDLLRRGMAEAKIVHVSVRDEPSSRSWRELFPSGPLPDRVRDPGLLAAEVFPASAPMAGRPFVGVNTTSQLIIQHHAVGFSIKKQELENWYRELITLLSDDFNVIAFTNGAQEDEAFKEYVCDPLQDTLPPGRLELAPRPCTPEDLCRTISRCKAVVAHRLHANIVAYSYGIPSVGLRWDRKVDAFFASVGREEFLAVAAKDSAKTVAGLLATALRKGIHGPNHKRVCEEAREGIHLALRALAHEKQTPVLVLPRGGQSKLKGSAVISRVVILNDGSDPRGGASLIAVEEARKLRARGIPVTYICGDDGAAPGLRQQGVEVLALGQRPILQTKPVEGGLRGLYNRTAEHLVRDWIVANDEPGVIYHLHNWSHILSPAVFGPLATVRERLLMIAHDFFLVCPNGAYVHYPTGAPCDVDPMGFACLTSNCDRRNYRHKLWRYARQMVRQSLLSSNLLPSVIAIHPGQKPILARGGVPEQAIAVLRNPVDAFCGERIEAERNDELLFVGRLESEKGPDLAARAAQAAGVKIRLIGDGPMMASLKSEFPNAIFCGRLSKADIVEHVRKARALLMPSRYPEPFGLVAVEALWSGLPVLPPRTGFLAPEIEAAGVGSAVEPRDVEGTANTIRKLFSDDELVRRMSVQAFENTAHFASTWTSWTDDLIALMETRLVMPKRPVIEAVGIAESA